MAGVMTVSKLSLAQSPAVVAAHYLPLAGGSATSTSTSSGVTFVTIGGGSTGTKGANTILHTLDNWNPSTLFALEAAMYVTGGATAFAALYDMTSNAVVAGSQISTTSSTITIFRSAKFALTPGHAYGVTLWTSNSANQASIAAEWLVAFPSS